jgi:hypothetical protein
MRRAIRRTNRRVAAAKPRRGLDHLAERPPALPAAQIDQANAVQRLREIIFVGH